MEDTAARLHRAAIRLLRQVRQTDAASGLTPARASVLSVLVFGGERTLGELAQVEMVTAPTMTRLVRGLESDGYVVRQADARDGRVTRVRATAKGRRVLESARRRRVEQVTALLSRLNEAEVATVRDTVLLLERVVG
jgi:DNA-binding MarR family transcriptional regulator